MSIQVGWYAPEYVLYIKIDKTIKIDDIKAMIETLREMILGASQTSITAFVDLTEAPGSPLNIRQTFDAVKLYGEIKDKVGWVLIVGEPKPISVFFINLLRQTLGFKMRSFETLETALAFLNEQDKSLPQLLPVYPSYLKETFPDAPN